MVDGTRGGIPREVSEKEKREWSNLQLVVVEAVSTVVREQIGSRVLVKILLGSLYRCRQRQCNSTRHKDPLTRKVVERDEAKIPWYF